MSILKNPRKLPRPPQSGPTFGGPSSVSTAPPSLHPLSVKKTPSETESIRDRFVETTYSPTKTIPRPTTIKRRPTQTFQKSKKFNKLNGKKVGKFLGGLAKAAGLVGLACLSVPAAVGAGIGMGVGAMLEGGKEMVGDEKGSADVMGGIIGGAVGGLAGTKAALAIGAAAAGYVALPIIGVGVVAVGLMCAMSK